MTTFLRQIARRYAGDEEGRAGRTCFIFPNKRSATFFRSAMEQEAGSRAARSLRAKTINSLAASLTRAKEATRLEALLVMYNEYRLLIDEQSTVRSTSEAMDFDRFAFWGDMLINDFNDVGRYLLS